MAGQRTLGVYTIDTVAAAAPSAPDLIATSDSGVSSTDNLTNRATPTVSGSGAEAGATVTLYDTNGTTVLGSVTADGTGNWSITSSLLTSGAHTLTAKQTDLAGNVSAASTGLVVTVDTVAAAPSAPDLVAASDSGASSTDNLTNRATPTVSGSGAEAGATVTLYDTNGTTVLGSVTADGAGNWSITSSSLGNGAHTLTAKQTDLAGNVSAASAGLVVTVDTVAAAPNVPDLVAASDSGASSTDNLTNRTTPTVSGSGAEAGATVTLYDTNGITTLGSVTADGAGNWSITSSSLGNGAHTLTAKQTDLAGNVSVASAGLAVTVDTVAAAPSAPDLVAASDSGASNTDNLTNRTTPTVSGSGAEAGATVTLYDTGGTTALGSAIADGAGNWSITSSSLGNGAHTLTAKQTDLAGNVSAASTALVVSVDTVAPAAPSAPDLVAASDSGASNIDNLTNNATPTVSGSGAEAGATVTLYDTGGATALGSAIADGSGNWSITSSSLANGAHTLTAKQTDLAGNVSAASTGLVVTVDTIAAAAPSVPDLIAASDSGSSSTDNQTSNVTPTVSGSGGDAGATVTLYDTNGTTALGSVTADGAGNWSITSSALGDGAHTLTAKQSDLADNASAASAGLVVTVDTVAAAPSAPDLVAASDSGVSSMDNRTNRTTPTVSGGGEAGATVTLYDTNGTTVLGSATADGAGNWSITSSSLTNGAHTLTAKQTDLAGNASAASVGLVVTVDTVAAAAPSVPDLVAVSDSGASSTDNLTNRSTPTVSGSGEAAATVTLYDTNGTTVLGSATANSAGSWSITSSSLTNGAHTLTAKQTDLAGNVSAASAALVVTIDTAAAAAPSVPDLVAASDSGVSSTDNLTNRATPTVSGSSAELGATVTLYDTDGITALGSAIADGAGNWSITSSALGNGAHALTAKQTDLAGNVGAASAGLVATVDTVAAAPSAPVLVAASDSGTSSTDNVTNRTTPTVRGSGAEVGATVTLYDTGGTTVLGSVTADGAGNWSITSSSLGDGAHTLTAKQTDLAGNVSAASPGLVGTVDTVLPVAPSAPDLVATSDSGVSSTDNLTNRATPTVSGSGEAGAKVTLYDTNGITVLGSGAADGAGNWSITSSSLGSGAHTLTAKQADLSGNVSAASAGLVVTVDTVAGAAPSAPDLVAASDSGASNTDNRTNHTTPTVSGSGARPAPRSRCTTRTALRRWAASPRTARATGRSPVRR